MRHGPPAVVPWTRGAGSCDVESIGRGRHRCRRRCHGAGRAAGDPDRGRSAGSAGAPARTGSGRVPGFDGGNPPRGRARGPGEAAPVGCPRWGWRTPGRLHDDQRRHPGADRCGSGGAYFLWKLLIDVDEQGNGYGAATIDAVVAYLRTRPGADKLFTSCADGPGSPRGFYLGYGFADTGRVMWGENVLALRCPAIIDGAPRGAPAPRRGAT